MSLEQENVALRRQVREMREELAEWERKDGTPKVDRVITARRAFRIGNSAAAVLVKMLDAPGVVHSREQLLECYASIAQADNTIAVQISTLRRALVFHKITGAICNLHRDGYLIERRAAPEIEAIMEKCG